MEPHQRNALTIPAILNSTSNPIVFDEGGTSVPSNNENLASFIVEVTLASIGVALNITVMTASIVLIGTTAARSKPFFISLSFSDLIICAIVMPVNSMTNSGGWKFASTPINTFLCMSLDSINVVAASSSSFTVVLIAVDRYICLTHPVAHSIILTPAGINGVLVYTWMFSVMLGILPYYVGAIKIRDIDEVGGRCLMQMDVTYNVLMVVLLIILPCSVVTVIYGKMFHTCQKYILHARRQDEEGNGSTLRLQRSGDSNAPQESSSIFQLRSKSWFIRESKMLELQFNTMTSIKSSFIKRLGQSGFNTSVTLSLLTGLFVLHWLPFGVVNLIEAARPGLVSYTLRRTSMWLVFLNSCWNPIVYTLLNSKIREKMYKRVPACLRGSHSRTSVLAPFQHIIQKSSTSILFPELEQLSLETSLPFQPEPGSSLKEEDSSEQHFSKRGIAFTI